MVAWGRFQRFKRRFQNDLTAQIGSRNSSSLLDLGTVDMVMICGFEPSDGSNIQEICAYAAYTTYGTDSKKKSSRWSNLLTGTDARFMRNALHDLRLLGRGSIFTDAQRAGLHAIQTDAKRAASLYAGRRLSLKEVVDLLRPYLLGTCPGLNSLIDQLPNGVRQPVMYVFNDLLRSMGNIFWCGQYSARQLALSRACVPICHL